jgi:hypothetical protein
MRPHSEPADWYSSLVRRIFMAVLIPLGACTIIFDKAAPIGDGGTQSGVDASPTSGMWWNDAYSKRRRISVSTTSAEAPAQTSFAFELDTETLVDDGELRGDGFDFRLIRHNTDESFTELARWVDDIEGQGWNSPQTQVWFSLPDAIAVDSTDLNTYLYYSNESESTPAASDLEEVFVFADDFENGLGRWISNGRGVTTTSSAEVRGGEASLRIDDNTDTSLAGVHRDQSLPTDVLLFRSYVKQNQGDASFGFFRTFDKKFADRQPGWNDNTGLALCELDSRDKLSFVKPPPIVVTDWHFDYGQGWHRIDVLADQAGKFAQGRVDESAWSPQAAMFPRPSTIESIALETEGQGGVFHVDNYIVRRWVDPAPLTAVEDVEDRR